MKTRLHPTAATVCILCVAATMAQAANQNRTRAGSQKADLGDRGEHREEIRNFMQQQKEENQAFRKELQSELLQTRVEATIDHRNVQYEERTAFMEKIHDRRMQDIEKRIDQNERLPNSMKNELLHFHEQQFKENTAFFKSMHNENISFLKSLSASDEPGSWHKQLSSHMKQQQQKRREHLKQMREAYKAFMQNFRERARAAMQEQHQQNNRKEGTSQEQE